MAMPGDDGDRQRLASQQQAEEEEEQDDEEEEEEEEDDDITMPDVEEEEIEGIDYSDKNLLLQLLMNQQLSAGIPITSRIFDKYITPHFEASSCELQGYRDNMEDEHLIHFNLKNHPNYSVFGVFDGHGGNLTSKFVKLCLIKILEEVDIDDDDEFNDHILIKCVKQLDEKWIYFEKKRKKLKQKQIRKEEEKIEKEVIAFTLDSDEEEEEETKHKEEEEEEEEVVDIWTEIQQEPDEIIRKMLSSSISDNKVKPDSEDTHPMNLVVTNEYGSVGSTCVFSLVKYNEDTKDYSITTVNLGDSRAILLRYEPKDTEIEEKKYDNDETTQFITDDEEDEDEDLESIEQQQKPTEMELKLIELTADHKPDDDEERQRILKAGGHVKFSRVDGDLALSRAIGDTRYKQNKELSAEEQKISCVPTITRQTCHSGDYLAIFCDGIVEYKGNEDVFQCLTKSIKEHIIDKPLATELKSEKEEQEQEQPQDDDEDDEDDEDEDIDLKDITICQHLRESELNYMSSRDSLGLVPKHIIELRRIEKCLQELTEWALETGSKDNMTAMLIKIGKTNLHNHIYQRIWSPCEFYRHKVEFNNIGEEIKDRDKITLDRFMRLFEADCTNTGWDMSDKYQNALLQKVLFVNDLITNLQRRQELKTLINAQTKRMSRLEELEKMEKERIEKEKKEKEVIIKKKRSKKRKSMDDTGQIGKGRKDGDNDNGKSPRKKRKLLTKK